MRLRFILEADWPPLAWHAAWQWGGECVVRHGAQVEVWEDRFFEGVWDGEFAEAGFDAAEHPCGSGAVIRGDEVVLVPPFHPQERIYVSEQRQEASNSLHCFLSVTGATLHPEVPSYSGLFLDALRGGAARALPELPLADGRSVALLELRPWRCTPLGWERVKPQPSSPAFDGFEAYSGAMRAGMRRLVDNASDSRRRARFEPKTELSTGFDSVAVGVWAREVGVHQALCTVGREDARAVGSQLGFDLRVKELREVEYLPLSVRLEFYLLPEGKNQPMALHESDQRGALIFSGHGGDEMWSMTSAFEGPECARPRDTILAGVSYTEYRLRVGFVLVPVPLMNQTHHAAIEAISRASELMPFRDEDPNYCRPIPRRVGVEGGVRWRDFGQKKHIGQVHFAAQTSEPIQSAIRSFAADLGPCEGPLDYAMHWAFATAANPYLPRERGVISPLK